VCVFMSGQGAGSVGEPAGDDGGHVGVRGAQSMRVLRVGMQMRVQGGCVCSCACASTFACASLCASSFARALVFASAYAFVMCLRMCMRVCMCVFAHVYLYVYVILSVHAQGVNTTSIACNKRLPKELVEYIDRFRQPRQMSQPISHQSGKPSSHVCIQAGKV
jgi:hypothetical protein